MKERLYLIIIMIFFAEGCAKVEITHITPENPYIEGIRFYRSCPYLLITKAKEGDNLECKIVYLPNKNEEYTIRVKPGIGSVETKCTLEDGWKLTEFGETRDPKAVEMVNAFTGSLKEFKGLFEMTKNEELHPGLYVFVFDDKTGLISGLKPVFQFK